MCQAVHSCIDMKGISPLSGSPKGSCPGGSPVLLPLSPVAAAAACRLPWVSGPRHPGLAGWLARGDAGVLSQQTGASARLQKTLLFTECRKPLTIAPGLSLTRPLSLALSLSSARLTAFLSLSHSVSLCLTHFHIQEGGRGLS